jgi:hypothetical protein
MTLRDSFAPAVVCRHAGSVRPLVAIGVLLLGLLAVGCEKPDRSYVTSPTLKTLIGTTTGNVAFDAQETPPPPQEPAEGWEVNFGLARFSELENGHAALQIVGQVDTNPGAGFELWITTEGRTVARWSGGSTANFVGTICFQLELEGDGEAVPLGAGKHTATMVFRDPGSGVIAARVLGITNTTPRLQGNPPALGSEVFSEALACPRGQ